MKQKRKINGLYKYLNDCGVLENGTEEDINRARRQYIQEYKRTWRRNYRHKNKALTITFSRNEWSEITSAARILHRSRTRFIKEAAVAYMRKSFVIPNEDEIRRIREMLAMNYCTLESLIEKHPLAYLQSGRKLLDTFSLLEKEILTLLQYPKSLEELIVAAVQANPSQKQLLIEYIQTL